MGVLPTGLFPTCLLALCRLFVLGIGFFSLCFLMTSLGGQLSARRPGDSPFTIRTEGILVGKGESEVGACVCGWRGRRPLNQATQGTLWGFVPGIQATSSRDVGMDRGLGLGSLTPHTALALVLAVIIRLLLIQTLRPGKGL